MAKALGSWLFVASIAALSGCADLTQQSDTTFVPPKPTPPPKALPLATPEYAAADKQLNVAYARLMRSLNPRAQAQLKHEEIDWIVARSRTCEHGPETDYACKTKITTERTAVLNDRLNQPATARQAVVATTPVTNSPPHSSQARTITVLATAKPWNWQNGGVNDAFRFGIGDGTSPAVVPLASLDARPGDTVTIKAIGGKIELGPGSPATDAGGYAGQSASGGNGVSGKPLPSTYMKPYPINLGALVGAFADASGNIVGAPFAVGNGPVSVLVPPGASLLQLGINDDIYGTNNPAVANAGSFRVSVER